MNTISDNIGFHDITSHDALHHVSCVDGGSGRKKCQAESCLCLPQTLPPLPRKFSKYSQSVTTIRTVVTFTQVSWFLSSEAITPVVGFCGLTNTLNWLSPLHRRFEEHAESPFRAAFTQLALGLSENVTGLDKQKVPTPGDLT